MRIAGVSRDLEVSVRRVTVPLLVSFVASVAFADAVDDGNQALNEERWGDAYRLLLPEARAGNTFAQYNVALMLSKGLGGTTVDVEKGSSG